MIHAAIFLLALGGFVLLLLAMPRHQQDWLHRKLPPLAWNRILRLSGFAALAVAFVVSGAGLGWGYGAVAWFAWLTAAAATVVAAHTNRERILRLIGSQRP